MISKAFLSLYDKNKSKIIALILFFDEKRSKE